VREERLRLDPDGANLVELAAVRPHRVSGLLRGTFLKLEIGFGAARRSASVSGWRHELFERRLDAGVILGLSWIRIAFRQFEILALDLTVEVGRDFLPGTAGLICRFALRGPRHGTHNR
jgi:hypothetical protein